MRLHVPRPGSDPVAGRVRRVPSVGRVQRPVLEVVAIGDDAARLSAGPSALRRVVAGRPRTVRPVAGARIRPPIAVRDGQRTPREGSARMSTATQNERIVALLRRRGEDGLTPLEALDLIGAYRLSGRIHDIRDRDRGYLRDDEELVTEHVTVDGTTFARYVIRPRRTPTGVVDQATIW
jgi:hypothetical protein